MVVAVRKFTAAGCALLNQPVLFNKCIEGCKPDLASSSSSTTTSGEWDLRKKLGFSDVAGNSHRIGPKLFTDSILHKMSPGLQQTRKSNKNLGISVYDVDTNKSFRMNLRKIKPTAFMISSKWKSLFVVRRNLHVNDEIGSCWKDNQLQFTKFG